MEKQVHDLQLKDSHSSSAVPLEAVWADMKNKKGKKKNHMGNAADFHRRVCSFELE